MAIQDSDEWKKLTVEYDFKGRHIREEALLTIDVEDHQIVVLPTALRLLAQQRLGRINLAELRLQAIANVGRIARHEPCIYDE